MLNFENCDKMIFSGAPPYGIPEIQAENMAGFSRQSIRTVRAELNDTLSTVTSARTIIDQRDNLSANRIVNLVRLEEGTGQVSAARRRRRQR